MKLSKRTIEILKNFSTVNEGIAIEAGSNKLKTISKEKSVFATATVVETFEQDAAFHDLNMLLAIIGKDSAELEFGENSVTVKSPFGKDVIVYCPVDVLIVPPKDKKINMPKADISFTLAPNQLEALLSKANIMSLDNVVITSEDGRLVMKALNKSDKSSHTTSIDLGEDKSNADFQLYLRREELKMLPETYDVQVSAKGLARFVTKDESLEYLVAVEKQGSYFKQADAA